MYELLTGLYRFSLPFGVGIYWYINNMVPFIYTVQCWLLFLISCPVIILASVAIYRLTFHPLAKHPGPFLAKLTDLWSIYHVLRGDTHIQVLQLHERYGRTVRLGPSRLSFNSAEALHTIYSVKANVQKSYFYTVFAANRSAPSTQTCINKLTHARKRRTLNSGFSAAAIAKLEPHLLDCVRTFVEQIGQTDKESSGTHDGNALWGKSFDMASWSSNLTFDVMGALVFGTSFNLLTTTKDHWIKDAIIKSALHKYAAGFIPRLYYWNIDRILMPSLAKVRERYRVFAVSTARDVLANSASKEGESQKSSDNLISIMSEAIDPITGTKFTGAELGSETSLLITAGSDTSSSVLSAAFHYLVRNPQTLTKLNSEVRHAFSDVEDIRSGNALKSCVYLRAVIDESMRLAPPVPSGLWRLVLSGGQMIDDVEIPAGIDVSVPAYTIMRNSEYYGSDAHSFRPERWLGEKEEVDRALSAFCPFSTGPRECIAKRLAYVELLVALARTLWSYDLRSEKGNVVGKEPDGNYSIKDFFITQKEGPFVQFRKRVS